MPSKNKQEWQRITLAPTIEQFNERQDKFETSSGISISPVYTHEDMPDFDYSAALGYPGEYPFTRGIQPSMYRGRLWTMRQYAGFGSAEESNKRYRYLIEQGQSGLSIAFQLPTQIGYDSDHPLAKGEVGKVGVAVDTLEDMEILFKDIPLDEISTSMTINSTAPILLAMYIALAKKQGVALDKLEGTIQNDILKEYIARGTHVFPPRPSMRLAIDIFAYCIFKLAFGMKEPEEIGRRTYFFELFVSRTIENILAVSDIRRIGYLHTGNREFRIERPKTEKAHKHLPADHRVFQERAYLFDSDCLLG